MLTSPQRLPNQPWYLTNWSRHIVIKFYPQLFHYRQLLKLKGQVQYFGMGQNLKAQAGKFTVLAFLERLLVNFPYFFSKHICNTVKSVIDNDVTDHLLLNFLSSSIVNLIDLFCLYYYFCFVERMMVCNTLSY